MMEVKKNRAKDRLKRLQRYKRASRNIDEPGENLSASSYKKKKRVETEFVSAPWSYVFFLALGYAIIINIIKVSIYSFSGKPEYTFSNPQFEQQYEFLEQELAKRK